MFLSFLTKVKTMILHRKQKKLLSNLQIFARKHEVLIIEMDKTFDIHQKIIFLRRLENSTQKLKKLIFEARKLKISDLEIKKVLKAELLN